MSANYYLKTIASGAGTTGGSTNTGSHVLTLNEIPAHSHSLKTGFPYAGPSIYRHAVVGNNVYSDTDTAQINNAGGGKGHTHTINPSFYTVIAWHRTA